MAKFDLYGEVTNTIIETLKKDQMPPWVKPWRTLGVTGGLPRNALTNKPYSGVNTILLLSEQAAKGYKSNRWLTYNQMSKAGGKLVDLPEGQRHKGTIAVYWNITEGEDGERRGFLRYFKLFNVDMIDGLDEEVSGGKAVKPKTLKGVDDPLFDAWVSKMGADIRHGGDEAFYHPDEDYIQMPERVEFATADAYSSTLLHELVHWTADEGRCNRLATGIFGKPEYASEELVAELGSAFLCAELGIDVDPDYHSAYIKSWLKALKNDKKFVLTASSKAAQAAAYLTSLAESKQAAAA